MRDDTEFGGFWSQAQALLRNQLRGAASMVFLVAAVVAIQFHERVSPALDQLTHSWAENANNTIRTANLALMSAALPFFVRG